MTAPNSPETVPQMNLKQKRPRAGSVVVTLAALTESQRSGLNRRPLQASAPAISPFPGGAREIVVERGAGPACRSRKHAPESVPKTYLENARRDGLGSLPLALLGVLAGTLGVAAFAWLVMR